MLNNEELSKNFYNYLENNGYKGKIVSAKYIPDLQNRFKQHQEQELLDAGFYEEFKDYFEFQPDVEFDEINSLFVMAIPQPHYEAIFHWNNKKISLLIPPTFLYGRKVIDQTNEDISKLLNPSGYHVTHARLPQKTLAVSCGLATYGRNNITYVKGMGSFHRLSTFYSDFPCDQKNVLLVSVNVPQEQFLQIAFYYGQKNVSHIIMNTRERFHFLIGSIHHGTIV